MLILGVGRTWGTRPTGRSSVAYLGFSIWRLAHGRRGVRPSLAAAGGSHATLLHQAADALGGEATLRSLKAIEMSGVSVGTSASNRNGPRGRG